MKPYSEADFEKNISKVYFSVFANEDPYENPLQPGMHYRLLLYTFSYGLNDYEPWLNPVVKTMKDLNEDGFYVTVLGPLNSIEEARHWYVPIEEAGTFMNTTYPRENAIYSINGHWGIIGSDEEHGVAGGNAIFYNNLLSAVSDWDERLDMFLRAWKRFYLEKRGNLDISWLPPLLTHIYGPVKTQSLLRKMDLD